MTRNRHEVHRRWLGRFALLCIVTIAATCRASSVRNEAEVEAAVAQTVSAARVETAVAATLAASEPIPGTPTPASAPTVPEAELELTGSPFAQDTAKLAARKWLEALLNLDGLALDRLTCGALKEQVQDEATLLSALRIFTLDLSGETDTWDLSEIEILTVSRMGDIAKVAVGGSISVAVLGIAETEEVGTVFNMVREGNGWVWCGEHFGAHSLVNIPAPEPTAPAPLIDLRTVSILNVGFIDDLDVHESLAFLAAGELGLVVVDVSDPTEPREISRFAPSRVNIASVEVIWPYAYLWDREHRALIAVDVSDPTEPQQVGASVPGPETAGGILSVDPPYAYVPGEALHVFSLANLASPQMVAEHTGDWLGVSAVDGVHGLAYILVLGGPETRYEASLIVLDVGDPSTPRRVGFHSLQLDLIGAVVVEGSRAYVQTQSGLRVIDVSDPRNPVEVGAFPRWLEGVGSGRMVVDGSFVYAPTWGNELWVIDVSGRVPTLASVYKTSSGAQALAVAVSDGLVLLGTNSHLAILQPSE